MRISKQLSFVYAANAINGMPGLATVPLGLKYLRADGCGLSGIHAALSAYLALCDPGDFENLDSQTCRVYPPGPARRAMIRTAVARPAKRLPRYSQSNRPNSTRFYRETLFHWKFRRRQVALDTYRSQILGWR